MSTYVAGLSCLRQGNTALESRRTTYLLHEGRIIGGLARLNLKMGALGLSPAIVGELETIDVVRDIVEMPMRPA